MLILLALSVCPPGLSCSYGTKGRLERTVELPSLWSWLKPSGLQRQRGFSGQASGC